FSLGDDDVKPHQRRQSPHPPAEIVAKDIPERIAAEACAGEWGVPRATLEEQIRAACGRHSCPALLEVAALRPTFTLP
ncbi:MAG: hypothetical protein K8W52_30445, partial [Deltaproteobacteria bacterium]|nr:hypothetical protein [Deltaproteobacteria bacterium]